MQARAFFIMQMAAHIRTAIPTRSNRWRDDELRIVQSNLGKMSEEKIAEMLPGRSAGAVKIIRQRKGMPASTKVPGWTTANQAAMRLGLVDQRPVIQWVRDGLVKGRRLKSSRTIWMINECSLKQFALNPMNWPRFNIHAVVDEKLSRLIALRQERWGDEWLTTRQVADMYGVDSKTILTYIMRGRIPAIRIENRDGRHANPKWANWFIRKSDVTGLTIYHHGNMQTLWTERADAFLLLAISAGIPPERIALLMKVSRDSPRLRLAKLTKHEKMSNRFPIVDWREHRSRFPFLEHAAERYKRGQALESELSLLAYVLRRQYKAHDIKVSRLHGRASREMVDKIATALRAHKIDPYL